MSESEQSVQSEPTPAEKRKVLQANGFAVGSRGKLSAEAENEYARLTGQTFEVGQPA